MPDQAVLLVWYIFFILFKMQNIFLDTSVSTVYTVPIQLKHIKMR